MTAEIGMTGSSWFERFFLAGGPIVWFVLLPMSAAMAALGLDLGVRVRRKSLLPAGRAAQIAALAGRYGLSVLENRLKNASDFLSCAMVRALSAGRRKGFEMSLMREAVSDSLRQQGLSLLRRAEGCHLIGTAAPMVGLFGTVFGMIQAFTILGSSGGQPRPDQLAESISVALVTTFWGLLTAIPALFLHGFFRNRIETLVSQACVEMEGLLDRLAEMGCFRDITNGIRRENPAAPSVPQDSSRAEEEEESPVELEFEAEE